MPDVCAPSMAAPLVVLELLSDRACMNGFGRDDILEDGQLDF